MPHAFLRALNDRRTGFEMSYALSLQDGFMQDVRAARAAGRWAAEQMGLSAEDAKDYAGSVVDALVAHNTSDPVFDKISGDLDARGVTYTPQWLKRQLATMPRG